jgi:hypothetical protein
MFRTKLFAFGGVCLLALAVACGERARTPVSPDSVTPADADAAADGSTLKVTAPSAQSPVNDARVDAAVSLVVQNATLRFAGSVPLTYRFEVYNTANEKVYEGTSPAGSGTTTHEVSGGLEFNKRHTWRARAEYLGAFGPWSAIASFLTPEGGYVRGNEILDPLTNVKTVGLRGGGPIEFIPGRGVKLLSFYSRISYEMAQNLQEGQMSLMVTGTDEGSPGSKTKIMSMQEGWNDITTNDYRFTIEKRGRDYDPSASFVTFRVIVGDATDHGRIFDGRRLPVPFSDDNWYFWKASWGPGYAEVEVRENDENGPVIYSQSVATGRPYRPDLHVVHIGAPVGRGGDFDASIPGMIAKNLWVSGRPRPRFFTFSQP